MKGCRFILIIASTILFVLTILSLSIFIISFNNEVSNLKIYNPTMSDKVVFLFTEYENWENLFSPAAVFFTGLSAIATLFLIYIQMEIIRDQNNVAKKDIFHRWMEQMFTSRNNILDSILSINCNFSGRKIFHKLSGIINASFFVYKNKKIHKQSDDCTSAEFEIYKAIQSTDDIKKVFKILDFAIDIFSQHTLNPYFHNIYATLKIIYEDKILTDSEKEYYLLMFRSQFTQQEFTVIYVHALV